MFLRRRAPVLLMVRHVHYRLYCLSSISSMNRHLNIKARAPSYNNTPSRGHDSSTRTLLKTTNAHACPGVSFVASVIRVLLLSYFKMVRKTIGPKYPKRTNSDCKGNKFSFILRVPNRKNAQFNHILCEFSSSSVANRRKFGRPTLVVQRRPPELSSPQRLGMSQGLCLSPPPACRFPAQFPWPAPSIA